MTIIGMKHHFRKGLCYILYLSINKRFNRIYNQSAAIVISEVSGGYKIVEIRIRILAFARSSNLAHPVRSRPLALINFMNFLMKSNNVYENSL